MPTGFRKVLERHGLFRPDGRPIYAYEIKDSEWTAIIEYLRSLRRDPEEWSNLEAAEFCVYFAEWWRREYSGGAWNYDDPLSVVGHSDHSYSQKRKIIEQGLAYLERPLIEISNGVQYLGTLATEGGIPLNLVKRHGNKVRRAFKRMFSDIGSFGVAQLSPTELGERSLDLMPAVFQKAEGIAGVLGSVAMTVWEFSSIVEQAGASDPLKALAAEYPKWRQALPLPADDHQIAELVATLLGDAEQEARKRGSALAVRRRIVRHYDDEWTLETLVELPRLIPEEDLARILRVDRDRLPFSFDLIAQVGERRIRLAAATLTTDAFVIERLREGVLARGTDAVEPVLLGAAVGLSEVGNEFVPIDDGLADEPWTFARSSDNKPWTLLSTGSVRTRQDRVRVAVPNSAEPDGDVSAVGTLHEHRDVAEVTGELVLHGPDGERWRIVTSSDNDENLFVSLYGRRWDVRHARGLPVFKREVEARVDREMIPSREIRWKNGDTVTTVSTGAFGDGMIFVERDGDMVLSRKACRIPNTSRVRVLAPTGGQPPQLVFEGFGDVNVGIRDDSVTVVGVSSTEDTVVVELDAEVENPPSSLTARVEWNDGGETFLRVPFPLRQASFITSDDRTLRQRCSWVSHEVGRITAVLNPVRGQAHAPYVEGRLRAKDVQPDTIEASRFEVSLTPEVVAGKPTGRFRLPLARIRNHIELALASTMDLDAHVQLRLTWNGCLASQEARLNVFRYEGDIEKVGSGFVAKTEHDVSHPSLAPVEMTAFLFREPKTRHELHETTDGEWMSPLSTWDAGTWCVLARRGRALSHRPLVVPVPGKTPDEHWTRVAETPAMEARRSAYAMLLQVMSTDPGADAWTHVLEIFDLAETLPATTFDVLDQLTYVPRAVAMALLKAKPGKVDRMWEEMEELPFMWHLVSYSAWNAATESYFAWLEEMVAQAGVELTPAAYLEDVVNAYRNHLDGEHPLFVALAQKRDWKLELGENARQSFAMASQAPEALVESVLRDGVQNLRRRQARDDIRWPDWKSPPPEVTQLELVERFRLPSPSDWQAPVINAPAIAAGACAFDVELDRAAVIKLRRLREFDSRWFDFAYRVFLTIFLAQSTR